MGRHNINWPIPQKAIDANRLGKLSQNPGYDGYDPNVEKWETWEEAVADENQSAFSEYAVDKVSVNN